MNTTNKIEQEVTGDQNLLAARDIHQTNNYFGSGQRRNSAIERVLYGIYDLTSENRTSFLPPDTETYTIPDKIEHNKLVEYKERYSHYADFYQYVRARIDAASDSDPSIRVQIIRYVSTIYMRSKRKLKSTLESVEPDHIINEMVEHITNELNDCRADLTLDELTAVGDVIFYVFAECKIFDKPPKQTT